MNAYLIIAVACGLGAGVLALLAVKQQKKQVGGKSLVNGSGRTAAFLIYLYAVLNRCRFTRTILHYIRKRLEFYSQFDERAVRKKTAAVFLMTASSFIALVLLFWLITRDAMMLLVFALIMLFLADTVIDIFISRIHVRLLKQQLVYHELLRHKYYELQSVEDANYEACEVLNRRGLYEIYIQAERISDILSGADSEASLEHYYEVAPNKYLKLLAGMIYITREYGDTKKDGGSVFIRGISHLSSEIRADIFKRERLRLALRSLNVISLLPVFLIKPLRQWAGESFTPLNNFYNSKPGIILGIGTVIVALAACMAIRRIQRFDKPERPYGERQFLENRVYNLGLYRIVDRLAPGEYTKKKADLESLIKESASGINLRILYTRRILLGLLSFLLGIILFIGLNINQAHHILYDPEIPEGYLGGRLSDAEYAKLQEITDLDREVLIRVGKKPDAPLIREALAEKGITDQAAQDLALSRILEKCYRLNWCKFKWYELLFCILFFFLGYQVPVLSLRFLKSVRRIDMEEEVAQFQTLILMLKDMNRIHVEEILEWMEMFSVHFKEPIQKCLDNFSSGSEEALNQLKEDVAFPPLDGIIENLQLANEELGVQKAFEELEDEMRYNQEKRKELNEYIVESKKNLGNMVGFLPVYALILLYLIVPMIVTGLQSLSAFYEQLSGL